MASVSFPPHYNLVRDLPRKPVTCGSGFGMGRRWKGLKAIAGGARKATCDVVFGQRFLTPLGKVRQSACPHSLSLLFPSASQLQPGTRISTESKFVTHILSQGTRSSTVTFSYLGISLKSCRFWIWDYHFLYSDFPPLFPSRIH